VFVRIEFVNHACLILAYGGVRLLCDPWLDGAAFNEGWALLAASVTTAKELGNVTHIWYSHEHPDHFSPRCLAEIPPERRGAITVLFHESEDRKIVRHCEALGFGTRELRRGERTELAPDFHVTCARWDHTDDSWLLAEAGGTRVLNLNDCMVNSPEDVARVKRQVGRVDVLATQFSISAWDGNAEEAERRARGGRTMLERTVLQCRALEARWLVPFASFVWFCHEENHYMNSAVVTVDEVARAVSQETATEPVVLYPGDAWEVGEAHRNDDALARWAAEYRSIPTRERRAAKPVPLDELAALSGRFCARLNGAIRPWRLRLRLARMNAAYQRRAHPGLAGRLRAGLAWLALRPRPARVWLTDLDRAATFDLRSGLAAADLPREACDVSLSSDSLAYAFRFLWGGSALQINGRFHEHHREGRVPLFDALWMADGMNRAAGAEARPL
jgi:L-ascorbate metabolism protein UlaG (beta-lactamase superfamily)